MTDMTRQRLELINRRTLGYPLQVAVKDFFLSLAIAQLSESPLRETLIFKGGTALHHCYLRQKRFSEDLDFTSLDPHITLEEIISVLEAGGIFLAKKVYESDFTLKIERLQYTGLLGQPGNIKIEIDHQQNVVLPGCEVAYQNAWQVNARPLVMDRREICAEKIRAVSQRARYRDFYDLYCILTELDVRIEDALALLPQKEIRTPIEMAGILGNWEVAREEKARDLGGIFVSEEIPDRLIEAMIRSIHI